MLALQRSAGNRAVAQLLARTTASRRLVQRNTSIEFDETSGDVRTAQYSRVPPLEYSLTLPKGAHVTAHVLFVEEALKAIQGKAPATAYTNLLQMIADIPKRELYLTAKAKDAELVAGVDNAIAKVASAYGGKQLTDFAERLWGQILARLFDAYVSFRAGLPGGIASKMSGQKQLLANTKHVFNESKGRTMLAHYGPEITAAFLDSERRPATRTPLLEGYAAGMAVTFDNVAANEVGQGMAVLLAEHVTTCFDLYGTSGAAYGDLQDWFLVYVGGLEYRDDVAALTNKPLGTRPTFKLSALNSVVDRRTV